MHVTFGANPIMHDLPSGNDDSPVRKVPSHSDGPRGTGERLCAVVEEYDHRPDQCTIRPADCSNERRCTRWITADASAFVDLDERR